MAYPASTRRRILPEQAPYSPLSSPHRCFPYASAGGAVLPAVQDGGNRAARPGEKTGRRARRNHAAHKARHVAAAERPGR
jgi:hypothetical protein